MAILFFGTTGLMDTTGINQDDNPNTSTINQMVMFNGWQLILIETEQGNHISYLVKRNDADNDQKKRLINGFIQTGSDNQAYITQDSKLHDISFEQKGENNEAFIMQSDSVGQGSSASVKQRGSGNSATIIQHN